MARRRTIAILEARLSAALERYDDLCTQLHPHTLYTTYTPRPHRPNTTGLTRVGQLRTTCASVTKAGDILAAEVGRRVIAHADA
jgi:hypothetical protein